MHGISLRRVELAVLNSGTGGHALHISRTNYRTVAHAVAMLERAFQNVSDDFHVTMRVHGKTLIGRDAIFIDDPQSSKVHVRRIVILIERESVESIQPSVIEVAAVFGFANR